MKKNQGAICRQAMPTTSRKQDLWPIHDEIRFYLYRASRGKGTARLEDLRLAEKHDGGVSWRPGYALYRHFAEAADWEGALRE
ncbi:MAG: hypothetical protein UHI81_04350, partial [Olegusella sp.]|nr:hypothetical protein [Olegusella sp.]